MTATTRSLVELILLGPEGDRRQLQDSPLLGDVWIAYADKPNEAMDLLITPHKSQSAGTVARALATRIRELRGPDGEEARISYLQGLVAARLYFFEIVRVVVPMTHWWHKQDTRAVRAGYRDEDKSPIIKSIVEWSRAEDEAARSRVAADLAEYSAGDRYITLTAIIIWGGGRRRSGTDPRVSLVKMIADVERPDEIFEDLEELDRSFLLHRDRSDTPKEPLIWQISLNRRAMPALQRSVRSTKADAARRLFNVNCDRIAWAVLDSGIDGRHPAFHGADGQRRVVCAYDFSKIRDIISLDNLDTNTEAFKNRLDNLLDDRGPRPSTGEATRMLKTLAEDAEAERQIHWDLVEQFIRIDPTTEVRSGHGTHVAGILGASRDGAATDGNDNAPDGMCPDISFYDFRVLGSSLDETEFAIIAALQFIRYLNDRHSYITIHGANLSLSIKHDVRNYACGRTPVCDECERLVDNGVVVVAAAGNLGYHQFETKDGSYEGYAAFSITDPGNADGVITVGATHGYRPHTYGVSFFSSRGPTGDGRVKPDLVAPGERIRSALPDEDWGELDGTSMAAPHVSGAAAMLMARYPELIGEPRRIKSILCDSATDLGRERSFQGHGLLDVLRAFQSL
ncbi:MAG: S8 family serine peptidase [candidate division Zixibacteria bacterium]|nr:S8 family serine peptidase [candidate division Zixibacteria bacterium]